ncbi:MAG: MerR family transcriptional regulator [Gammaproteobacteria bacterium]|nr:MerR family transcriptional regulator [Gammaproteobacteria bacterium]
MSISLNISDVSRIAGVPKDLLRMWERRYGFPKPARDDNGDRVYSDDELDKLIAIKRLVDQGKRPGKLMAMDLPRLQSMMTTPAVDLDVDLLLEMLRNDDTASLHGWFQKQLLNLGLRTFIYKVMAPATHALGDAWARGELDVYQEHLCTELVISLVRQSLAEYYRDSGSPRIMLTTMQGEAHGLGLLMVEALLRIAGAKVISFGTEMPMRDIIMAPVGHSVDIVGLSFSCHFNGDDALVMLSGLRERIPSHIPIWVGGNGFAEDIVMPEGVELFRGLYEVEQACMNWPRTVGEKESSGHDGR